MTDRISFHIRWLALAYRVIVALMLAGLAFCGWAQYETHRQHTDTLEQANVGR
jgi:hypothetical protein